MSTTTSSRSPARQEGPARPRETLRPPAQSCQADSVSSPCGLCPLGSTFVYTVAFANNCQIMTLDIGNVETTLSAVPATGLSPGEVPCVRRGLRVAEPRPVGRSPCWCSSSSPPS
jgi:hypothetical protein